MRLRVATPAYVPPPDPASFTQSPDMGDPTTSPGDPAQGDDMAGYPRVIGYYPGTGMHGYLAGVDAPMLPAPGPAPHMMPVHGGGPPSVHSPPWRPMMAPGSPPLGEGHVPIPLNPETFGGVFGNTTGGGAPAGTTITFSARPQKPYKLTRLLIKGSKQGTTALNVSLVGQVYIGTDLQQGEVGNIDLESLGAANAFDTWVSFKQAEPGVWIRVLATLNVAFPTGTDFAAYTITAIGHYLH
jgi:hypothetical protein